MNQIAEEKKKFKHLNNTWYIFQNVVLILTMVRRTFSSHLALMAAQSTRTHARNLKCPGGFCLTISEHGMSFKGIKHLRNG